MGLLKKQARIFSRNRTLDFESGIRYPSSGMIKSIQIAGHRIPVRVKDLGGTYGQYLPDSRAIELAPETVADAKLLRETLRHEMMEATLFLSGHGWGERYEQEPIVRCIDEIFWPAWERVVKRMGWSV